MTIKLYGRLASGSLAVETLLRLTGMPFEWIDVPKQADGSAPQWFREINTRGQLPTLALADGTLMTESAAMMLYLADLPDAHYQGKRLAPGLQDRMRPSYLRWMVFLTAAAYDTVLRYYYSERFSTDPQHADAIKAKALIQLDADFEFLATGADVEGPFLLGSTLSAIDIYAAMLLGWHPDCEALFKRVPRLKHLYSATMADPAIRDIFTRNDMP